MMKDKAGEESYLIRKRSQQRESGEVLHFGIQRQKIYTLH